MAASFNKPIYLFAILSLIYVGVPATALANGGIDLSKQPSRALAQQAIGLVNEAGDFHEAKERVDAAIKSKDRKDINLAELRKASKALSDQDKSKAIHFLDAALTKTEPAAKKRKAKQEKDADHEERGDEEGDGQGHQVSKGALHKEGRQFKPLRTTEDTVGAIVGGVLVLLGFGGLLMGRRRKSA